MSVANAQADTFAKDPDLGTLIAEALAKTPERPALRVGDAVWTRQALLEAARDLAGRLAGENLQAGEPVVLDMALSFDLVAGLCGVLLAGGAAVPVDPALSDTRRRAITEDVNPRLVLSCPDDTGISIETRPRRAQASPGLAFLVYTSGSSGGPKGVEITQASYVGRLCRIVAANPPTPGDTDLIWTPPSFIGFLDEVFFPLLLGVPSVIARPDERSDPRAFSELVARERITTFRITPSLLDVFLTPATASGLAGTRAIFCSGETMSPDVQTKMHDLLPETLLVGFYGASEAPGVGYHVFTRDAPPLETTICTPQDFVEMRIADTGGAEVAAGDTGEIWLGGIAVAGGYWNKPELSGEKFVTREGTRWYRTGDRGRRLKGGQIEILGRADMSEVNILGVRVSVPETRMALAALEGVRDAWISAVEVAPGRDPVLVGHCLCHAETPRDPEVLKAELGACLPPVAVPRLLECRADFPLTDNGKLDVQGLIEDARALLAARQSAPDPDAAPLPEAARVLLPVVIGVAEDVLKLEGLGPGDDFFALGGNSLLAVQFSLLLSERLGVDLSTTLVFSTVSLREIAEVIAAGRGDGVSPLRLFNEGTGNAPPLFTINSTGNYALMAPHMDPALTVYNVNMFGLTNALIDSLDTVTLDELATRLAGQILEVRPRGPFRLVAFCQDGCLAVEIGRILQAQTGVAPALLLIDTFFLDHAPSLKMWALRALDLGPGYFARRIAGKLFPRTRPAARAEIPLERRAAIMGKSRNDGRLYRRFMEIFMAYRPPRYDGPVVLFVSREWRHVKLTCVRAMAGDGLVVKELPGLHDTVFAPETVSHLARAIEDALPALTTGEGRKA